MSNFRLQKHMNGTVDSAIKSALVPREMGFNETENHAIYKHEDNITFATLPSEDKLSQATGAEIIGIDDSSMVIISGDNVQETTDSIDLAIQALAPKSDILSKSTANLLTNTGFGSYETVETIEHYDGTKSGGAKWKKTGSTGSAGTTDFASGLLYDGDGNERKIIYDGNTEFLKAFGAKGDGVTDDYAAIQAAHDFVYVTSDLQTFNIDPGLFVHSQQLIISGNLKVRGNGDKGTTSFVPLEWKGSEFYYSGAGVGILIQNITTPGNFVGGGGWSGIRVSKTGPSTSTTAIHFNNVHESTYTDLRIVGTYTEAVQFENCDIMEFGSGFVIADSTYAMAFTGTNADINFHSCNFWQNLEAHFLFKAGVHGNIKTFGIHAERSKRLIKIDNTDGNVDFDIKMFGDTCLTTDSATYPGNRVVDVVGTTATYYIAGDIKIHGMKSFQSLTNHCITNNVAPSHGGTIIRYSFVDCEFRGCEVAAFYSDSGTVRVSFLGDTTAINTASATVPISDPLGNQANNGITSSDYNQAYAQAPLRLFSSSAKAFNEGDISYSEVSNRMRLVITDTVTPSIIPIEASAHSDSVAADVATIVSDFNSLLAKLRTANVIDT